MVWTFSQAGTGERLHNGAEVSRAAAERFGKPGREIFEQRDFYDEIRANKPQRGPSHAKSRNDAAAFVKNGRGNTAQSLSNSSWSVA